MKKLEKLTPEQEASLPEFAEKWLKIGLSTEPLDLEKAKQCAIAAYEVAGLQAPVNFYRFQSPYSAAIGATYLKEIFSKEIAHVGDQVGAQVRDQVRAQVWDQVWDQVGAQVGDQVGDQVWAQVRAQVGDQVGDQVWDQVWAQVRAQVRDQVYGFHDADWLGFYDALMSFGCSSEKLIPLMDLAKVCGWWAPYKNTVIFQDRPEIIKVDDAKRLHCENGPSVKYRDGFSVYSWHGIRIPMEWIENKNELTAKTALTWENVEQRRAACEIVGWAKILRELNAKTIDKNQNPFVGELIEVEIPEIGREKFLRVRCGTEREFALPVPPDMKRASQAQAWLNWTTEDMYLPQLRT